MAAPSKLRSSLYAAAAGLGLAGVSYWIGTIHGADRALGEFRDLSFQSTEASMQRLLRFDALLGSGDVIDARRKMGNVAWSHYTSLEDDAAGAYLPPSAKMQASIAATREAVGGYCRSGAALPAVAGAPGLCEELARRSR
jgi:hypothetical protein